jgi:hypothetical protein
MRILIVIAALLLFGIVIIAVMTHEYAAAIDRERAACERIGGVMARLHHGGSACVLRALPPSAKGSKWT